VQLACVRFPVTEQQPLVGLAVTLRILVTAAVLDECAGSVLFDLNFLSGVSIPAER
jgi:hypothetical protein